MSKERRLGRGLEALLGRPLGEVAAKAEVSASTAPASAVAENASGLIHVAVDQIDRNPFQPRAEFDEASLAELAASMREHGLIQPLVARKHKGRYQLIAGERRLRTAMLAGWTEVPVHVREADDRQISEIAIVENLQRKDLNALEKAASFEDYLTRYKCTQEELAGRLGIDRSTIANLIRLLELPEPVQQAIRAGSISPGHARALLPLGDEREQIDFCDRIIAESLSVRAVEQLVGDVVHSADQGQRTLALHQPAKGGKARGGADHQIAALEQEVRSALGLKVEIKQTASGRGKMTVHFRNHEEFELLHSMLCRDQKRKAG